MKDIRDAIQAAGRSLTPGPAAFSRTQAILARRRQWRRARAGAAALASALVVAGVLALLMAKPSSPPVVPGSSGSPASIRIEATASIGARGELSSAVYGGGALWVSVNGSNPKLLKLDPTTLKTIAEVPLPSVPTFTNGGGGLAYFGGAVWEVGEETGGSLHAVVRQIDPASASIKSTTNLPGELGVDVTSGDGSLWVLTGTQDGNTSYVTELDSSLGVAAQHQIPNFVARSLTVGGGTAWVSGDVTTNYSGNPALFSVDLVTGAVHPFAGQTENVESFAVANGRVVALDQQGVEVFSPDGSLLTTLDIPPSDVRPPLAPTGGSGVWIVLRTNGTYSTVLAGFDGTISSATPLGGVPIAIVSAPRSAWILMYRGSVIALSVSG